jgi:hypothetical protein
MIFSIHGSIDNGTCDMLVCVLATILLISLVCVVVTFLLVSRVFMIILQKRLPIIIIVLRYVGFLDLLSTQVFCGFGYGL